MSNVHIASREQEKCYRCGASLAFWEIQCGACGSEVPKGPRDIPQTTQLSMEAYNAEVKRRLDAANIATQPYNAQLKQNPWNEFVKENNLMQDNATIIPTQAADQRQVDGKHYKELKVQPWTVLEAILTRPEFIGYLKGCIIKYGMRQGRKENSPEDGEKCNHYIEKLREMEQNYNRSARA